MLFSISWVPLNIVYDEDQIKQIMVSVNLQTKVSQHETVAKLEKVVMGSQPICLPPSLAYDSNPDSKLGSDCGSLLLVLLEEENGRGAASNRSPLPTQLVLTKQGEKQSGATTPFHFLEFGVHHPSFTSPPS